MITVQEERFIAVADANRDVVITVHEPVTTISQPYPPIVYNCKATIENASKTSALDGGTKGDQAWDDDYIYVCTQTGLPGHAIWKRSPLINT